jgi:NADH-quinone oxidoreductase subunit M
MNGILLAILVPLAAGILSFVAFSRARRVQWAIFYLVTLFGLAFTVVFYGAWDWAETIPVALGLPGFAGFRITLVLGGLRYIFFAASSLVTAIIALYSLSYNDRSHGSSIAPLWTILLGANAGIFMAGDWITFLFAWELMGWTSYFIIAHGRKGPREAALYYYILSLVGTATLLAAVFVTVTGSGSFLIADGIAWLSSQWTNGSMATGVTLITLLFTVSFLAKSAVFPFYMWPSKAHAEAPDDFSSFLSGVMIKYGVFALILIVLPVYRSGYVGPAVNGVPLFLAVLGWFGVITAVLGTLYAIPQDDMKRLMAYSTVSHVGYITAALSMNSALGIAAAMFHTVNHMVFKGGIFLSMGAVKYRTGERMMHRLGGMGYRMPVSFFTFLVCIIAAAGIPPMSGFASKWMVFQSLFDRSMLIMVIPMLFASTGGFLYLYRGLHTIYLGQLSPRFRDVREAPATMSLAMVFMMLLVMLGGFFPGVILSPINAAVVQLGFSPLTLTLVGIIFFISFFIVAFLYLSGKKRELVEPLDTYTAGEDPAEWGLTEERYHYGMSFYEPFEESVRPFLRATSFDALFSRIGEETGKLSANLKRWFNTPQVGTILLFVVIITILYIAGRFIL